LFLSFDYMRETRSLTFEYPVLVLLASTGMMMMISANDLIALYLGLELQSLALYVVAAIRRDDVRSSEAGLKYFVLGALSSGMLLYGASLIYGFTGSTSFAAIAQASKAAGAAQNIGLVIGLVFLLVGIAFKISAVPFHMWTPDVYEGAPTPVTNFLASAPKVAAVALFMRVSLGACIRFDRLNSCISLLRISASYSARRRAGLSRLTRSMATSFAAAAALPLPPPFCPLALASARAAFLAAISASCSGVISGRPALPGAFFSSSLSAISEILYEVSNTVPHFTQTRRFF